MDTSLFLNFAAALLATGLLGLCWWLHIRLWLASRRLLSGQGLPPKRVSCENLQKLGSDFALKNTANISDPQAKFKHRYLTLSVLDTTGEYADLAFDRQGPDTRLVA